MKMAKASTAEQDAAIKFVGELEENRKPFAMTDEELGKWVRKCPPLMRVVFGYQVLFKNCADPAAEVLEFKPEIKLALDAWKERMGDMAQIPMEVSKLPSAPNTVSAGQFPGVEETLMLILTRKLASGNVQVQAIVNADCLDTAMNQRHLLSNVYRDMRDTLEKALKREPQPH